MRFLARKEFDLCPFGGRFFKRLSAGTIQPAVPSEMARWQSFPIICFKGGGSVRLIASLAFQAVTASSEPMIHEKLKL